MKRLLPGLLVVLAACVVAGTSLGAPDRKAPRIVTATMLDRDGDARADRVRLRFSERIRHAADKDRKYPFRVSGYRIRSVGKARGRTLVIRLVEKSGADETATPPVRYRRTKAKPVRDRAGNQARAQSFRRVRAHGSGASGGTSTPLPPPSPPPPPPNPNLPPDTDPDRDGYAAPADCQPDDPAVHPSAEDRPDLTFADTNCDGIDGTEAEAVFASPSGNDGNPGTKAQPKRQIQTAVAAAAATDRYVLAAAGQYGRVEAASGVGIYGGYNASTWSRSATLVTSINGGPEGVLADKATSVVLQLLSVVSGNAAGPSSSAYGIRVINGSSLTVQRVAMTVGNGSPGAAGLAGSNGPAGGDGVDGGPGKCDGQISDNGGDGGSSPTGRTGGRGGTGGPVQSFGADDGYPGRLGQTGTPGGAGGQAGDPGQDGDRGQDGSQGADGTNGTGGTSPASPGVSWTIQRGGAGADGAPGNGGGGGGGGGAQTGLFVDDGGGNGGGGGGGGGDGGKGGIGGTAGGGSFGIYLHNSTVTVSDGTSITPGNGGAGGRGGNGGLWGPGGLGGGGATYCTDEIGAGGDGGNGGIGGRGGGGSGGAGGPSIGIFKAGTSTATVTDSTVTNGTPGAGGAVGSGGTGTGGAGAAGIARPIYPS